MDPWTFTTGFILIFALIHFFGQLPAGVWFSWMGELAPPAESASFWSRRNAISQGLVLFSSLGFGFMLDYMGPKLDVYLSVIAVGCVAGLIEIYIQNKAVDPSPKKKSLGPLEIFFSLKDIATQAKNFIHERSETKNNYLRLLAGFSVHSFFAWLFIPFAFIYLQKDLHVSPLKVQIFGAFSIASSFAGAYFYRIYGARFGMKSVLVGCFLIKIGEFSLWTMLADSHWINFYFFIFTIAGLVNIGIVIAQFSLLTIFSRSDNRAFLSSSFFAVQGLISFFASNLSGFIYELFKPLSFTVANAHFLPFHFISFLVMLSIFFTISIFAKLKISESATTLDFLKNVLVNNPFKILFQSQFLSRTLTEKGREHLIFNSADSLFEETWIKGLDSPSSRVRGETFSAILRNGKQLGSKEVENRLLELSEEPFQGQRSSCLLILGQYASDALLPTLIAKFSQLKKIDTGRAQTLLLGLGRRKTKTLAPFFRSILKRPFSPFHPLAAEALGSIGQAQDAELIFKVIKNVSLSSVKKTHHPIDIAVYRGIIIALSRIWQPKADLFPIFEMEAKERSTGFLYLLKRMSQIPETDEIEAITVLFENSDFQTLIEKLKNRFKTGENVLQPIVALIYQCTGRAQKESLFILWLWQKNAQKERSKTK
jgi:hypothetical protein